MQLLSWNYEHNDISNIKISMLVYHERQIKYNRAIATVATGFVSFAWFRDDKQVITLLFEN